MPFVIVTAQGNQACQTTDMYELASVTLDAAEGKFGDTSEHSVASSEVLSFNHGRVKTMVGIAVHHDGQFTCTAWLSNRFGGTAWLAFAIAFNGNESVGRRGGRS